MPLLIDNHGCAIDKTAEPRWLSLRKAVFLEEKKQKTFSALAAL